MSFTAGGPFQAAFSPMLFWQAGFSGPPSPGKMSAAGSMACPAKDGEQVQPAGSPRSQSPSVDSADGEEGREQCTFDEQMQRQHEGRQHAAGVLLHFPRLHFGATDPVLPKGATIVDYGYLSMLVVIWTAAVSFASAHEG